MADDDAVTDDERSMFLDVWRAVARLGWLVHGRDPGAADYLNELATSDALMPVRMATAMVTSISKHLGMPAVDIPIDPEFRGFLRLCDVEDFHGAIDWWADADGPVVSRLLYVLADAVVQIYQAEGGVMRQCFDANCPVHGVRAGDQSLN